MMGTKKARKKMGRLQRRTKNRLFLIYDKMAPKDPNIWVMGSKRGMVGNTRFLLDAALQDERLQHVRFFVLSHGPVDEDTRSHFTHGHGGRVRFVDPTRLEGKLAVARAGYVFLNNSFPIHKARGRTIINLWHGIATKNTWLLKTRSKKYRKKAAAWSALVSSSPMDSLAKAAAFHKTLHNIWLTGNPRNDILANDHIPLGKDLLGQQERLHKQTQGKRLVLYAPTWRRYKRHHGDEFNPFRGQLEKILEVLEPHNAVLGMRLHPADEPFLGHLYDRHPSLLRLGADRYPETQVLLKNAQVLVTDFSSIWVDHLLTRRPMIAYWPDLDDYSKHRGTIWELDKIFPGPISQDPRRLAEALDRTLGSGCRIDARHQQAYTFARDLFHTHHDGGNTRRLLDRIHRTMYNGSGNGHRSGPSDRSADRHPSGRDGLKASSHDDVHVDVSPVGPGGR